MPVQTRSQKRASEAKAAAEPNDKRNHLMDVIKIINPNKSLTTMDLETNPRSIDKIWALNVFYDCFTQQNVIAFINSKPSLKKKLILNITTTLQNIEIILNNFDTIYNLEPYHYEKHDKAEIQWRYKKLQKASRIIIGSE